MRPDGVEVELGFGGVELERAALVPRLEQRAIDVHEWQQLVGEPARGPRSASGLLLEQRGESLVVGQAADRSHHRR